MERLLRYHPLFVEDAAETANWYDAKTPGLGDTFLEFVGAGIDRINAAPLQFPIGHSGCRFLRLAKFPHAIIFEVFDNRILILGVLHTSLSPAIWSERVASRKERGF